MDSPRIVKAGVFKAQCLALIDQVERTRVEIVITKRGRPVARVVPLATDPGSRPTERSVTLLADDETAYFSTGEPWDADRGGGGAPR